MTVNHLRPATPMRTPQETARAIIDAAIGCFNNEFCPDWDYGEGLSAISIKPGEASEIKDFARETGESVIFQDAYSVAIAPLWFLAAWLVEHGDFDREAARIDRPVIDDRGAADWTIAGNVLEDRAARPCDVMRFDDVLFAYAGEDMDAAREGIAIARECELTSINWTLEVAREYGRTVKRNMAAWEKAYLAHAVAYASPFCFGQDAASKGQNKSGTLYRSMRDAAADIERSEAYAAADSEAREAMLEASAVQFFEARDNLEALADSCQFD